MRSLPRAAAQLAVRVVFWLWLGWRLRRCPLKHCKSPYVYAFLTQYRDFAQKISEAPVTDSRARWAGACPRPPLSCLFVISPANPLKSLGWVFPPKGTVLWHLDFPACRIPLFYFIWNSSSLRKLLITQGNHHVLLKRKRQAVPCNPRGRSIART